MKILSKIIPKLNQASHHDVVPHQEMGNHIPKIFHQIYLDKVLPPELESNREQIVALNKDWDCRVYGDDDIHTFILAQYGAGIFKLYQQVDPRYRAARADLFRYLLLYKVGGVYLDVKSSPTIPLSNLINDDDRYLLSYWTNNKKGEEYENFGLHPELGPKGEFQQWFIACAAGHPYLKSVLESIFRNMKYYFPSLHGVGRHGVLQTTGPITYTHAIMRVLDLHPHRFVDSQGAFGIKYSIVPSLTHKRLFSSAHYSTLADPVFILGPRKRVLNRVLGWLKKLRPA